jgi:membrane associated rhomboid family serine protease
MEAIPLLGEGLLCVPLNNWLDRFAMKHSRFGIPGLMRYIIIGNAAVLFAGSVFRRHGHRILGFWPGLVLRGEVWRVATFLIVPERMELLWFAVALFFYYYLGTTLEREWGSAKFTLFYLSGAGAHPDCGFIGGFSMGGLQYVISSPAVTMSSVNFSLFLAFATLYPDAQIRVYFILPVKAKWLAVFYLLITVWNVFSSGLFFLPFTLPGVAASLINYAVFFWSDIARALARLGWRARRRTSRQTVNFRAAKKHAREKRATCINAPSAQDGHRQSRAGVSLLLQMQRLLLLLHGSH